jgi:hypothetical protein
MELVLVSIIISLSIALLICCILQAILNGPPPLPQLTLYTKKEIKSAKKKKKAKLNVDTLPEFNEWN